MINAERAAEAERQRLAQLAIQQSQVQQSVARAQVKPAGLVVREVWKFEVLDIRHLVASNPALVRFEPNTAAINEAIRNGLRTCPGLRIYSETVTGVRL